MLLIHNIGYCEGHVDAAILVDGEKIFWIGQEVNLPPVGISQKIDAEKKCVIPGLIDCHSHLIFSGSRCDEFAQRMNNESYQEIMAKGGGIFNTVRSSTMATDEELYDQAKTRASLILQNGVTTLEAKSGYGLCSAQELRSLRILKQLDQDLSIDIHPTFLAHAIPKEFSKNPSYIHEIIKTLELVVKENLAIDCDIFCEEGAFSLEQSLTILRRAHDLDLGLRAHVQQLGFSDGLKLIEHLPIKSLSHLDFVKDEELLALAKQKTIVEILPFACLFLRSPSITPAKKLKSLGIKMAIATDFNPGSAMCHDLILAARLGVTMFGLNVEDALLAITKNASVSLGRTDIGELKPGMLADIIITNCQSINEIFYDWTKSPIKKVIKRGKLITP